MLPVLLAFCTFTARAEEPPAAPDPAPAPEAAPEPPSSLLPPEPLAPIVPTWPAGATPTPDTFVTLLLTVDDTGVVTSASPISGAEPFLSDALTFARTLRFRPATEAGLPVAVEVPLTLTYTAPSSTTLSSTTPPAAPTESPAAPQDTLGDTPTSDGVPGGVIGTWRRGREESVRHVLSAEEVRTTPGTLGDPLRAITNLPGAVRSPLDAGWLLVRGGDPRDTGVYIDGVRVPLVYHLGGFTSVVHPAFVQQVAFIPGGQSARYGRATAGVVDLVTAPPPSALDVHAGANLVLAGVYAGAPLRGGGVMLGARRSYLDLILDAVPGITEEEASIAPRFTDAEAKVQLGPTRWTALSYVDHIDASTSTGSHIVATVGTWRLHEATTLSIGDRALELRPYVAQEWYRLEVDTVGRDQEEKKLGGGIRAESPDPGTGALGWSAGLDATADRLTIDDNLVHRSGTLLSPEAYGDLRLGTDRRLVFGLRVDDLFVSDQLPRAALSPRASGRLPLGNDLTLTGDLGVYHQPPPQDLLVGPPEGASLRLEASYGAGVGLAGVYGPFQVETNLYGRRIEHVTGFELDGTLGQGQGLAYGVETLTRYSSGRVSGWMTFGWSRSLRREDRGLPWAPSLYDQPLTVVLVGAWDAGRRWTLAGRLRYASGFAPPPVADPQAYDVLTNRTVDLSSYVPGRLPPFHALDVKASKRTAGERWRLDWYLDAQNVYNRRVPEPVITGFSDLTTNYVYGYGLPILLIFGVDGQFTRRNVAVDGDRG